MKIKVWGTPQAPQKSRFWRTKAKMGYFSEKGLFYSFEILHGLLSNKMLGIQRKRYLGNPPYTPN